MSVGAWILVASCALPWLLLELLFLFKLKRRGMLSPGGDGEGSQ